MLLMIRAFSTQHPAMAFMPDVRLICHWLPPAFVPTMFRPLSCSSEATKQYPLRVIRWSDNAYIAHYYAAAALIPERLRWNIARAGNRLPLAVALLFRRLSFGSGASTSRRPVCRTDLYRAGAGHNCAYCIARRSRNSQRDRLHGGPSTRREMSDEMGRHNRPSPNIRHRTMHSIVGAFV